MENERKDCMFRTICKRVPAGAAIGRPESRYYHRTSFSIFNSQFSRFFIEEEYTLNWLFQKPCGFNRQLEGRVVLIVLHRHDGLPRYPEQPCHVLLPQAARLAEFFNVVLHLQRQNFHIKSANITTGMKIRFTISPASALLDGGSSSSSFAAR